MKKVEDYENEYIEEISLINAFSKAAKKIKKAESISAQKVNITSSQFGVLLVLTRHKSLPIKNLIEENLATSGNMTVVLKNMERDGFIKRNVDPEDRRSFLIEITQKGDLMPYVQD